MFNKLKFNNLVISNKKKIQQSSVQTINKLVQKIRKLKSMLEKRPENEKTKEHLRKTTETMEQLKKLKGIEIMKRILVLDKSPTAIITNGLALPEEIAIAMMAMNKIMQDLTKKFKEELNLKAGDESWKYAITQLSKRRLKINRTEEKRQNRNAFKVQKALTRKRVEWLQENVQEAGIVKKNDTENSHVDEGSENDEQNVSTMGVWNIESIDEQKTMKPIQSVQKQTINKTLKSKGKSNKSDKVVPIRKLKTENIKNKKKPEVQIDDTTDLLQKRIKKERDTKINFNTNLNDHQDDPIENPFGEYKPPSKETIETEEIVTHVEDPFFITESGENYLSTAVITRNNTNNNDHESFQSQKLFMKDFRKTPKPRNEKFAKERTNNARNGKQEATQNTRNIKQEATRHNDNSKPITTTENLHPSWAAKQKFKPVITNIHGKKITFGDDDDLKPIKITQSNMNAKSFTKDTSKASTNDESQQLHPSWAAKQKQKPTITAFQGKKITFDGGDE